MDPSRLGSRIDNGDYRQLSDNSGVQDNPYVDRNAMAYANPMLGEGIGGASFENMIPPNDQNMNYYQEYCRLFIANVVLTTQMKELIAEKNELSARLSELEKGERFTREPSTSDVGGTDKKSRLRRKAAEIERHYHCPVTTCQKNYGSEGSLIQHVKLKHPEITDDPDWKVKILHKSETEEGNPKDL